MSNSRDLPQAPLLFTWLLTVFEVMNVAFSMMPIMRGAKLQIESGSKTKDTSKLRDTIGQQRV